MKRDTTVSLSRATFTQIHEYRGGTVAYFECLPMHSNLFSLRRYSAVYRLKNHDINPQHTIFSAHKDQFVAANFMSEADQCLFLLDAYTTRVIPWLVLPGWLGIRDWAAERQRVKPNRIDKKMKLSLMIL